MDIQLTGVLVSKTGDFINDYQEFNIQGGQEGLNSILAEELEPDTLYWIKGIFVKDGVEYESKPAQFKTYPIDNRFRIINTSGEQNTIELKKMIGSGGVAASVSLDYSTNDGRTWSHWSSDSGDLSVSLNSGGILILKGDNTSFYGTSNAWYQFASTGEFEARGNIMYMLDSTGESVSIQATSCFSKLFNGCSHLTVAPELTATTLAASCYSDMFQGCTSLVTAPDLPATTLADYCYYHMFGGCTSLINAPELPATTLSSNCYGSMFGGCTALVTAPELPATTLAQECYMAMFLGCTSLVTPPPIIDSTSIPFQGCYQMFQGCTSLLSTPELPATTIFAYGYRSMFQSCSSLTAAPATLPATTLYNDCYRQMFMSCSSLTAAPALPATTIPTRGYYAMFMYCTSIREITVYATSWDINNSDSWLLRSYSSGDFYNLGGATIPSGDSGIPSGWTEHTSI